MGFSVFLLVLLCEPAGLAVHCENLFHWWAIMPVLLLESKNLVFSGERKWVLSVNLGAEHRKTQFFCVKHQGERTKLIWVNQKKIRFFDERSKTAIIANQWMQNSHSKLLTQLVSNAKPTEKKEKPIELRAFSFFQVNKTFSGFRKWKDGAFFHVPYINRTGKRFSFRQKRLRKQGKH